MNNVFFTRHVFSEIRRKRIASPNPARPLVQDRRAHLPAMACRNRPRPFVEPDEAAANVATQSTGRRSDMRFMVMVKANAASESGVMPSERLLAEMGRYNEELAHAGVLLAGEGLHPSSRGARVRFSGSKRTVIDGPFAETRELVAGFWLIEVKSLEEAIEWVRRCPNPVEEGESEIEIRQVFEAEDFGAELTPALREQEERLRSQLAARG
jgi:hypothetical protein